MEKCICPVCRVERRFTIKDKVLVYEDDSKKLSFFYLGVSAVCNTCNESINTEETNIRNKRIVDEILKGVE